MFVVARKAGAWPIRMPSVTTVAASTVILPSITASDRLSILVVAAEKVRNHFLEPFERPRSPDRFSDFPTDCRFPDLQISDDKFHRHPGILNAPIFVE
jgi:hypothetical protein